MTHAEDAPGSSDLLVVANRLPFDLDADGEAEQYLYCDHGATMPG